MIETDKIKQPNRIKIIRAIDNKRTISSQQGHYARAHHQRKFTIEYEPKKSIRQPLVPRKNHSLPRTLTNNGYHNNIIGARKLASNSNLNESVMANKTMAGFVTSGHVSHKNEPEKNDKFLAGLELFGQGRFSQAIAKFELCQQEIHSNFPKNNYYLGLCYWKQGQQEKSVFNLYKALDQGFPFETQTYSLLAKFYESTRNYNCALKTLDEWLKNEANADGYLMRGRIHFHFKEYTRAIADYTCCYSVNPTQLEAYVEDAEATYKVSGLDGALEKYNRLLVNYTSIWPQSKHSDINYVKYKKSLLLLQEKSYSQSLSLLCQITNVQLQSEVCYYMGIIYTILGKFQEAGLAFGKSILANTSDKFVGQSYYEKFVMLFKRNDYYGIQHEFDLIGEQYQFNEQLEVMRKVIEGIIYILKMNFQQGIKCLNGLTDLAGYQRNDKIYLNTVTSFKVFGYYSLYEFELAYQQFSVLKNKKMADSNRYNYTLIKGIRSAAEGEFNAALGLFEEAEKIEPFNTHTFMVRAVIQIMLYCSLMDSGKNNEQQESNNEEILLSAEELLNRCLQKQPQNDQILYILSSINYELGQYESGLKLIRKAIDASDDHTIKHYYLKANLKLMLGMQAQAISDYSNAILVMNEQSNLKGEQLQENKQEFIYECYLQRAKCYILDGCLDKAEGDLRIFFSHLTNVKKYGHELQLFMQVGCSTVILDIYKSILEQEYDGYSKMKCYYLAKELNNCLSIMNVLLEFSHEDNEESRNYDVDRLIVDRDCLDSLKGSSNGSLLLIKEALKNFESKIEQNAEGDIFKKADCLFYAGVMCFLLGEYPKAKNYFIDSKGEKLLTNQLGNDRMEDYNEENQIFSLEEVNYNIGICDFAQGKWSNYLQNYAPFKKFHNSTTKSLGQQPEEVTPFEIKNRLCSIYQPKQIGNLQFRLSFCLPKIKISPVKFHKNSELIRSIGLRDIDMRPSAPWIQKSKKGIIFTTDILKESIDLKSQKSRKGQIKKKAQDRYKNEESA